MHISTSEVYGTATDALMDENHPLNPMSPYAAAKCGADRLVYSYWQTYQIPAVIIRPFNNFGPYQHLEKVVPRFITSCVLGEPLTVHGDGSARRDFIFVDDHCEALDRALHVDRNRIVGQVINIGTRQDISVLEIAKATRTIMRQDADIQFIGNRPGQVFRHTCDASKAEQLLGWTPRTSFHDGLKRTIQWYVDNREWWAPQKWMRHIPIITADGRKELH
jgi:dTDP-glucose 4,6-dehydratase